MKFLLPALLGFVLLLVSCTEKTKTPDSIAVSIKPDTVRMAQVPKEGAVPFQLTEGTVYWTGKKATGGSHNGTIKASEGELLVNQGHLLSGRITLDMNSIAVADIQDGGERRDLESHLKDQDFFDVAHFPKGVFEFEEVLPSNDSVFNWVIHGRLTMKGKSNTINIPVRMTINGDVLAAESPTFMINRTQWGVNFRSGALGTAKDQLIEDSVPLALKIKAKKG